MAKAIVEVEDDKAKPVLEAEFRWLLEGSASAPAAVSTPCLAPAKI